MSATAVERGGNNLNGVRDVRTANDSSQDQNLALIGWFVLSWLDSGAMDHGQRGGGRYGCQRPRAATVSSGRVFMMNTI
jgi:hypothetical protein